MIRIPSFLKKGDTVLIIGTARARNRESLQFSIDTLQGWGFKVECGEHLYKVHHQFAGTDRERASDLQWAVKHPVAKAVIIAGGGYGTLRIIDAVNFSPLKKYPKWFCGYSDTTVLHARLIKEGLACIHSTMAFQFSKNKEATQSLLTGLLGKSLSYHIPVNNLNREGNVTAEVVGGNLSILYALSGSADDVNTNNKILFIEDLDEQLYHIDRMMLQLKRSGKLKKLKGLVVGGMSDMKDNAIPFGKSAEEIIHDAVKDYDFPVCFGFPAGHIEVNKALFFGRKATLKVSKKRITFRYL